MVGGKPKRSRSKASSSIERRHGKARKHVSSGLRQSDDSSNENSRSGGNTLSCTFNSAGQVLDFATPNNDKTDQTLIKVTDKSPTDVWSTCMTKREMEVHKNLQVKQYSREKLFPRLKMFCNPTEMQYSSDKKSLCQRICRELGVRKEFRRQWWTHHCKDIRDELNKRRSEVTSRMRKVFICK